MFLFEKMHLLEMKGVVSQWRCIKMLMHLRYEHLYQGAEDNMVPLEFFD